MNGEKKKSTHSNLFDLPVFQQGLFGTVSFFQVLSYVRLLAMPVVEGSNHFGQGTHDRLCFLTETKTFLEKIKYYGELTFTAIDGLRSPKLHCFTPWAGSEWVLMSTYIRSVTVASTEIVVWVSGMPADPQVLN